MTAQQKCKVCGKPLSPTSGEIGGTCLEHEGKLRSTAVEATVVPEGWLRMSKVCQAALDKGIKISAVVTASGGDACTKPIMDKVFEVTYVGKAKYMNPAVVVKGFEMLLAKAAEPKAPKAPKPAEQALVADTAKALKAVIK
jgi:hypothetical protein